MVVALSTFLCANSSTYPSPQYLGAFIDVSKVNDWNWSKLVYDWMFSSITNYKKKHWGTIGGYRYFLAVSLLCPLFSLNSVECFGYVPYFRYLFEISCRVII